jgi:LysM repeat protein
MADTTAPLPDVMTSAAATTTAICPYLLADEGAWRSATPAREHRCTAVSPAAVLAPDKQRRLCLTREHTGCATFLVATGQGERKADSPMRIERVPRAGARDIVRTVPVVLDRGRVTLALPGTIELERHVGQIALIALMAVAFIAILVARLPGDGSGGGAGAGALDPTATARIFAVETPTPGPTDPKPLRTLVPTEVEPSAEPAAEATEAPTAEPTKTPRASEAETYKVKRGDTLSGIAAEFGTTVKALQRLNDIDDPRSLRVGQVLELP